VLDVVLAPGFLPHVERVAILFKQRLAELKDRHPAVVAEIRGEGLLLGLRLHVPNTDFAAAARAEGLLTIPAGDNVVRLMPPLVIGEEEVREAYGRLDAAATALEEEMRGIAQRGAAE
jgi:acetylornithine/N-succinyldiaminopimelate aminotransferase